MKGINAESLNLPQEVFDLLKDSVITVRISESFTLKSIDRKTFQGGKWVTISSRPYIQLNKLPVQIGEIKDLGLNSLLYLMEENFEHQGVVNGAHRFVRPRYEFTPEVLALHNASAANSITYSPEQIVEIIDTPEGASLVHHYGEELYMRKAVKDNSTGRWTWIELITKERALELPVVPAGIRVMTDAQLNRYVNNRLTSEQFDELCFEERKLTAIDTNIDVAHVFVEVAEESEGVISMEAYFNGKTTTEKPLSEYTAKPTGWWSRDFRSEWRLFNEQPLPDVLTDGVHDMRDTAAAMSEIGNFGMVARVYAERNDPKAFSVNYRPINEGEVPHYDAASHTFVFDPSKKASIEGSIRIKPIVSGKEATYNCSIDLNTKEISRFKR